LVSRFLPIVVALLPCPYGRGGTQRPHMLRAFGGTDQALDYALQQLPGNCGKELIEHVNEASALCAEANRLTTECRAGLGPRFEPTIIESSPTPTLVIRVAQPSPPSPRGADALAATNARCAEMVPEQSPAVATMSASEAVTLSFAPGFWSLPAMRERVQRMRGLERRRSGADATSPDQQTSPQQPSPQAQRQQRVGVLLDAHGGGISSDDLLDPWQQEFPLTDVAQKIEHLETALSQARLSKVKMFAKILAMLQGRRDRAALCYAFRSWAVPPPSGLSEAGAGAPPAAVNAGSSGGNLGNFARARAKAVAKAMPQTANSTAAGVAVAAGGLQGDRAMSAGARPRNLLRCGRGRTSTPNSSRPRTVDSDGPQQGGVGGAATASGPRRPMSTPRAAGSSEARRSASASSSSGPATRSSGRGGTSSTWTASAGFATSMASTRHKTAMCAPSPKASARNCARNRMRDTPPRTPSPMPRYPVVPAVSQAEAEGTPHSSPESTIVCADGLLTDEIFTASSQEDRGLRRQSEKLPAQMKASTQLSDMLKGSFVTDPSDAVRPEDGGEHPLESSVSVVVADPQLRADLGELKQLRGELREMCSSLRIRLSWNEVSPTPSRNGLIETSSGKLSTPDVGSGSGGLTTSSRSTLLVGSSQSNSVPQPMSIVQASGNSATTVAAGGPLMAVAAPTAPTQAPATHMLMAAPANSRGCGMGRTAEDGRRWVNTSPPPKGSVVGSQAPMATPRTFVSSVQSPIIRAVGPPALGSWGNGTTPSPSTWVSPG